MKTDNFNQEGNMWQKLIQWRRHCAKKTWNSVFTKNVLFLLFATQIFASNHKVENGDLPGMTAQPTEYFFTGKPFDSDLDAFIFRYRNYDPASNRWTSSDPSGFPDGLNAQKYLTDPISTVDSTGLVGKKVVWVAAETAGDVQLEISLIEVATGNANLISWMMGEDLRTVNTGNATHYLDDGDVLEFGSIDAVSQLNYYFSSYDQVYLVVHGNYDGTFWIGSSIYKTSDIWPLSNEIVDIYGCIYGDVNSQEIIDRFTVGTKNYLLE